MSVPDHDHLLGLTILRMQTFLDLDNLNYGLRMGRRVSPTIVEEITIE